MSKSGIGVALIFVIVAMGASLGEARAQSCASERGTGAKTLVDECLQVSPATHPPCNAANACSLIESEIRRGCGFLSGADRPAFCDDYR